MSTDSLDAYLDVEERESQRLDRGTLRALSRRILRFPGPFIGGLLTIAVGTVASLIEPRLFGYAIDEAIVPQRWDLLQRLMIAYLFLIAIRVMGAIAQGYLFELLGQRLTQELRCDLYAHMHRLPISVYDKNPAGRLLTRVTNDIASLSEMFSAGFVSMVGNALMLVGTCVGLVLIDARLALITLSVFPFLVWISAYFSRRLKLAYRDARSKLSALNAFLAENLMGMKVVHLFNRQKLHLERFSRINQWYGDAQIGTIRVFALFQPSITTASGIAVALLVVYGGRDVMAGQLKVGVLVAYFTYVLSMFQPLREIADKWNIFLSGMTSAERIFSILGWETEGEKDAVPAAILKLKGHIEFRNVWFAYSAEHWVLKDFNLEIQPGMRVGVVGHTGAGKTTLISLLLRFYEPQKGQILIDGRDIREYDRRALRSAIGIVQQDVFLFSGSVEENTTFWGAGGPAATERARAAMSSLGFARLWEQRASLQERGSNLSMGERQVLSFVRAASADPSLWILDEATANMDSSSELLLQSALATASRDRTMLIIAHRLATVKDADRILVLHKGTLIEQGTHRELLSTDGLYSRIYRYQRAASEAEVEF